MEMSAWDGKTVPPPAITLGPFLQSIQDDEDLCSPDQGGPGLLLPIETGSKSQKRAQSLIGITGKKEQRQDSSPVLPMHSSRLHPGLLMPSVN